MTSRDARATIVSLRAELEIADNDIVEAIARRQRIVDTVAAVKQQAGLPLRDRMQETAVLERCEAAARQLGADPFLVGRIFREVIAHAVRVQEVRARAATSEAFSVAFQGTEGAYGHIAARRYFSYAPNAATYRPQPTFRHVVEAVAQGEVDYGVLPIENSTAGSINETYDLLSSSDVSIVGEEISVIDHCLTGLERRSPESLKRIYSHPQALAQCSDFLATLPSSEVMPCANTAMAAEQVRKEGNPTYAAIASEEAAQRLGLVVLARSIANESVNLTRFVIIAKAPIGCGPGVPCTTSIVFTGRHERGMLLQCLNALADRGLNLQKLESRPLRGSPWAYQFYVDFDGNADDPSVQDALNELRDRTLKLRVLGTYPSRTSPESRVEYVRRQSR
jgi:chorismate mutase/prephenate dehydratase